ncbi:MAG: heavy-metal-associated domain-containing protein [Deltaproteobacteria bacterium]|nr:heavy-metal-associated domain-containing protein [Deltaproteobacteria bacterium]
MTTLFSRLKGISGVSVNTITGSVLITYDPDAVESERILNFLKAKGYLRRSISKKVREAEISLPKTRVALGKALFGWAVGNLLQNTGLSFLTVLI